VSDTIKMAEWEMVERVEEANNFRILAGSSNDFNSVCADPNTTLSSGTLYITNDYINTVEHDKLIDSREVADPISDINVKL
jgi:hypothetical protein